MPLQLSILLPPFKFYMTSTESHKLKILQLSNEKQNKYFLFKPIVSGPNPLSRAYCLVVLTHHPLTGQPSQCSTSVAMPEAGITRAAITGLRQHAQPIAGFQRGNLMSGHTHLPLRRRLR